MFDPALMGRPRSKTRASRWIEDTDGHLLAARLKFSAFDALPKQMCISLWSEHISKYSLVADGYQPEGVAGEWQLPTNEKTGSTPAQQ